MGCAACWDSAIHSYSYVGHLESGDENIALATEEKIANGFGTTLKSCSRASNARKRSQKPRALSAKLYVASFYRLCDAYLSTSIGAAMRTMISSVPCAI